MVTEDPAMAPGTLAGGCIEDYERDLEVLLREQNQHGGLDTERDLNICRSGSAPPLGGHQGFYYLKEDLKGPRMQQTMLWPSSQGVQVSARSVGKIGDGRRKKELSAGTADMPQEGLGKPTCGSGLPSRPKSTPLHNDMETRDNMYSGAMSHSFSPALGSCMARSTGPEPQLIRTLTSPCLHALGGRFSDTDQNIISNGFGGVSSGQADCDDVTNTLFGLNLSDNHLEELHQRQYLHHNNSSSTLPSRVYDDFSKASFSNGRINLPKRSMVAFETTRSARPSGYYQTERTDIDFSGCDSDAYSANQGLPLMSNNQLDAGEGQYFNRIGSQVGSGFQVPITDSLYAQYLRRASDFARPSGPTLRMNRVGTSLMDLPGYEEAYVRAMLAHQKLHYDSSCSGKSGGLNSDLYGNPAFALDMSYLNHLSGSVISSLSPRSHLRADDRVSLFPSILRSTTGGSKGSWNHENGIAKGSFASSLLEELKNNKTRLLELSEIVGHAVEFSVDQYGSRFIQQKLETASVEEKNSIFPEILPHARVLMTDVFGNYVIQKFFDYGTEVQRDQLAASLIGYILPLSLQMYGCRVIQKALEVVDLDQQTQMVAELVGSVMKCVRDQNGNHVIQKCIECVPQERIQFIVTCFYGQVVALSTHPYGCRVIQRVLEHCDNTQTQSRMLNEILQSVCMLAQDQYGNYVIQHILQHGKPEERSSIVSKLAGQIVKMSQQKFASNVVEKCLTFCTPDERELLIDEMLGSSTDENEAFQAMMKDQFGNYVVQRVLESCDDQKLQLIISRIKVHLSVLKKYTYGKHIVARVEKLVATGERRIVMSLANLA